MAANLGETRGSNHQKLATVVLAALGVRLLFAPGCHWIPADGSDSLRFRHFHSNALLLWGIAIVPVQDILGLASDARMNLPGRPGGNWRWRFEKGALTPEITERLRNLTDIYGRAQ